MPFKRSDDRRERVAKAVLRFPPEQRPCAGDVEDIVVVAAVDHPGLNEVTAAKRFVLQDNSSLRERPRDTDRLPPLPMERLPDDVLDLGITGRVWFADEQWQFWRQCVPPIDQAQHGRSEEHTSELQSLMRNSYAVFCLKKKKVQ